MIKKLLVIALLTRFLPVNAQIDLVYQSPYPLNDVLSLNADTVYACGDRGIIVTTTNGGSTWQRDSLPTKFNLKSIVVSQKGIGYTAGDSGTVFRSVDFGKNWVNVNVLEDYNLTDLQLVNDSMVFVKIEGKGILATSDTGKTWTPVLIRPDLNNHLYLGNTGYVSSEGKLYHTLDAGITWDSTSFNNSVHILRVTEIELLVSSGNNLYSTTDTCKTFDVVYTGIEPIDNIYTKFQFIGNFGILARWDLCTCQDPIPPFLKVWRTEDNGRLWLFEGKAVTFYGTDFSFVNKDLGFILSLNNIYKTITGELGVLTGNPMLKDDKIVVISPNPVTGVSSILWPDGLKNLKLIVYNSIGAIIEEIELSGTNNTIEKNNKPNGVYLYKLLKQGVIISTGKLIVQ